MTTAANLTGKYRIASIDLLRGIVMLIMAIDHVRDNFQLGHPDPTDLNTTTPALFFMRWITHFCAPTFVFLSGISAYLAGTRRTSGELSGFLIKRGLWLILVEVVVITFALTLDPLHHVLILQVIWAIGGSMILLGVLVGLRASLPVIGGIGAIIVFGHNSFDLVSPGAISETVIWKLLVAADGPNRRDFIALGANHFVLIAYALLPWTGVMLLGYVFGSLYKRTFDAVRRRKILLYTGLGLLALFFVFRAFNLYGDPAPWSAQKTTALSLISFLNVTKYPCSLLYVSMTIGVALVVLAITEHVANRFASFLIIFGNVPFFYYVCHWYLIQVLHVGLFFAMGFTSSQIINPHYSFPFCPDGFGFTITGLYLLWLVVILLLYYPCKWFSNYKKTHQQWWVSYL